MCDKIVKNDQLVLMNIDSAKALLQIDKKIAEITSFICDTIEDHEIRVVSVVNYKAYDNSTLPLMQEITKVLLECIIGEVLDKQQSVTKLGKKEWKVTNLYEGEEIMELKPF